MSQDAASSTPNPADTFEMKAGHFTLPTLLLRSDNTQALDAFLAEQAQRAPQFFDQAPLVLDLSQYPEDLELSCFPTIVGMVRGHGMIPIGVRGATTEQEELARMLELAIMPRQRSARETKPVTAPAASAPASVRPSKVVEQTVRSGQRIYAEGTDLVLLGGVSSGAEVMADGNIHAYGAIRGRALAGVRENTEARIFCHDMGAELIAIAGRYRVLEDMPQKHVGRSVQISLRGDSLIFSPL